MGMSDSIRALMERITSTMSEKEFFESEIARWKGSEERRNMIDGERYFRGEHDILKEERTVIGKDGRLKKVDNLPNNHIVDNQYQRLVNQKVNYLMGRPMSFDGENELYVKTVRKVLGKDFQRNLKCIMRDSINMGISWVYVYTDEKGNFRMKRIPAYEIIPFWTDSEHTSLDRAVRIYQIEGYRGKRECVREMVEIYSKDKVEIFEYEDGTLVKEEEHNIEEGRIPLVAFKYNEKEIPLIKRVKSLQDALNKTVSDFENTIQQDAGNTVLVLQNYDGTDLGEFRHNLSVYNAVKVRSVDGTPGDIKTLDMSVDTKNFTEMISLLKSEMTENAMGYDPKSDILGNNPNQLVVRSMLSDLELDASEIEVEFSYAFTCLKEFVDLYLEKMGYGYFEEEELVPVFNRDTPVNEGEIIENCIKSMEILSEETVLIKHPWVGDVKRELERKRCKNG